MVNRALIGLLVTGLAAPLARTQDQELGQGRLLCSYTLAQGHEDAERRPTDWNGSRYELGRRLRAFERAFASADEQARARAVPALQRAVGSYFMADAGSAARALDAARRSIEGDNEAAAWADSLVLEPPRRCIEPGAGSQGLTLAQLYELEDVERPVGELRVRIELVGADGSSLGALEAPGRELPQVLWLSIDNPPEGDHELRATIELDGRVLARSAQTISVVRDARKRLDAVLALASDGTREPALEAATLRGLWCMLLPLTDGKNAETDLPVARLVAEAEEIAASLQRDTPWLDANRSGDHWLRVPVEGAVVPVRLRIPAGLDGGEPVPLVVGLHGAGGSENMFFEAYGDGLAPRLAAERGWLFVSPRAQLLGLPPVPDLVDALAARLPVDRSRVALVGHSMGAAHGARLVSASPGRFAAVALLSGGGSLRGSEPVRSLPFWLGAGEHDFGLAATRRLADLLGEAGAERVEFHVLPHVEHLAVVQAALPEVFAFFDAALEPR